MGISNPRVFNAQDLGYIELESSSKATYIRFIMISEEVMGAGPEHF